MRRVSITGLALWAPGTPSLAAYLDGSHDPSVTEPPCAWVPPRLLRGSSRLTRMFGEAAAQATSDAGHDPKTIATVYTSSYGEIETMIQLLDVIFRGDGQLSPIRFKNSVHNAASGLGSIGQSNTGFTTALAAGPRSFEAGMIEAIALAAHTPCDVVVSAADDTIPAPLGALDARRGLAIGVALSSRDDARALATVEALEALDEAVPLPTHALGRPIDEGHRLNPAAAGLALLDAVRSHRSGRVPLAFDVAVPFAVTLGVPTNAR